jgi:hypothetical protein
MKRTISDFQFSETMLITAAKAFLSAFERGVGIGRLSDDSTEWICWECGKDVCEASCKLGNCLRKADELSGVIEMIQQRKGVR